MISEILLQPYAGQLRVLRMPTTGGPFAKDGEDDAAEATYNEDGDSYKAY